MNTGPYSGATIARAREHFQAGWSKEEIRELIQRDTGRKPSWHTIQAWLDPEAAERRRGLGRRGSERLRRRDGWRPHQVTDAYVWDRLAELYNAGLTYSACATVARVLWGRTTTHATVRDRLQGARPTRQMGRVAS